MENRYKIPVPFVVRWGDAESEPGLLLVEVKVRRGKTQANPALVNPETRDEGILRVNEVGVARLPRKTSKLQLQMPVPQSDTGRRGE